MAQLRSSTAGWVKWEKSLETDPRFIRLVRKLRNTCVTHAYPETMVVTLAVGCLVKIWSFADTHIRADDTIDLSLADIDDLVGFPGFAHSMPDDWLRSVDDDHVELPDFQRHNGIVAKKIALAQKRMARKRASDKQVNGEQVRNRSVTPANGNGSLRHDRPDQTRLKSKNKEPGFGAVEQPDAGGPKETPDPESASRGPDEFDPGAADRDLDPEAYLVWTSGLAFLGGESKRSVLGMLVKRYTRPAVAQKLGELMRMTEPPKDPTGYLVAAMQKTERKAVC